METCVTRRPDPPAADGTTGSAKPDGATPRNHATVSERQWQMAAQLIGC